LRFAGHKEVVEQFNCICPSWLFSKKTPVTVQEVKAAAAKLQSLYHKDLSTDFMEELVDLKNDFGDSVGGVHGPKDLLQAIYDQELGIMYPEVVNGLLLFLTIPVTVASAERSFSKLKLIKTYLRSSMSNERLSSMAILSIEDKAAADLDKAAIIYRFASSKLKRSKRFGVQPSSAALVAEADRLKLRAAEMAAEQSESSEEDFVE